MLQTVIIYILIYFCALFSVKIAKTQTLYRDKSLDSSIIFFLGIIIYSLIIGLRWNVGDDYLTYFSLIKGYNTYDTEFDRIELIPRMVMVFIQDFNIPFYLWFTFMAYVQIYFLEKAFSKDLKKFVVWGVFFFLTAQLTASLNVVRHIAAVTIMLYAYSMLIKQEYKKYFLWVIIASLFHKSALIGIPIFFISKIDIKINRALQLLIVGCSFVLGEIVINYAINTLSGFSGSFSYLSKLESINDDSLAIQRGSGLGVYYYYLRYIILILYSKKLFREYAKYGFGFFYTMSFIGICLYSSTMYNIFLSRMNLYFTICSVVCLAMLMVYLSQRTKNQFNILIIISIVLPQIILSLIEILNSEQWNWVWDVNLL